MAMKEALAGGGVVLAALAFFVGSLFGESTKPVENVVEPAADAVGLSPVESNCPDGWKDTSTEAEHAVVFSCTRGTWVVFLNADRTFSHAREGEGAFEFDRTKVTGWR